MLFAGDSIIQKVSMFCFNDSRPGETLSRSIFMEMDEEILKYFRQAQYIHFKLLPPK